MSSEIRNLIDELRSFDCSVKLNDNGGINLVAKDKSILPAELIQQVRARKAELIDYLQGTIRVSELGIEPVNQQREVYPISDAQRRIWVLSQFDKLSSAYNIPAVEYLEGDLDVALFKKAINLVIERHEILRTVFVEEKINDTREVGQRILSLEELNFSIDVRDFSDSEDGESALKLYIKNDSSIGFDLEKGPLFRAGLLRSDKDKYVFYYNMHHIISDGWSTNVLSNDVLKIYEGLQTNSEPDLVPLHIQYKDYASWQLEQVQKEAFQTHKEYWLNKLSGDLPILDLPGAKERPKLRSNQGGGLRTYIDASDSKRLKQYASQNQGSLFIGLMALWKILLHRYTAQEDIIVGTVVAGRDHEDLEHQIGFYVNSLAIRSQIKGNESFHTIFHKLKENTLEDYKHQMYPFDRLIEELQTPRDTSRNAIIDSMFTLQESNEQIALAPEINNEIEKEVHRYVTTNTQTSKFDMTVLFKEIGDFISFEINYSTSLYDRELIERLMKHFKSLLNVTLSNPEKNSGEIDFLSPEENLQLISQGTPLTKIYSTDSIVDLFKLQVNTFPNKVALSFEGKTTTFSELDKLSDDLAICLVNEYDIQSNDRIGIYMDRSDWFLVAVLAVLKAGAAYVPIDMKAGVERQEFILKDCDPKVLLILSESMFDILEFDMEAFSVDIQLSDWLEENPTPNKSIPSIQPSQLAYMIYTSGSTGTPKGVEITHENLANYLNWAKETYADLPSQTSDIGFYSSPSFDLTVTSLFLPLVSGTTLHVYPSTMDLSDILTDYFDSSTPMDLIKMTPAHVQVLQHLDIESTNVKTVIVGGEELHPNHVRILRKLNPQIRIFNEYGPTECTVGCTACEIEETITIGTPIANTQVYVVNEFGLLQPEGIPGELLVGGKGVARGYRNRDELTNERFVEAKCIENGPRVYKTGDIVRWLPNGMLAFLGRNDNQVKIRGYRVELGEIEEKIASNEYVESAVVKVHTDAEDKSLLAYYIPNKDRAYTFYQSVKHAEQGLPDRMNLHDLPNGMKMYAYNKTELHFVFEEIFDHDVYLKHGIKIPDGACVFDVGANDGMFSLYAHLAAKEVTIHAFEPLPPTYQLLKHNTELYQGNYTIHNFGLSNKEETAEFSYFPNATVLSTRYQETNEVESIVKKFIKNANEHPDLKLKDEQLDTLLGERLVVEKYSCHLQTLSHVMASEGIGKIDLLKVDVEKSELDVLEGIETEDWKKIDQIVIEVHDDANDRLGYIKGLLESHEYTVIVHQSDDAQGTNLYDLYARKNHLINSEINAETQKIRGIQCPSQHEIEHELIAYLKDALPEYMLPKALIPMSAFPIGVSGKIDKKQLKYAGELAAESSMTYVAPNSELEKKLVEIWEHVLQKENIGLKHDFFTLGGHSLKAIRLINEYQKSFDVKLAINDLFVNTTLESHVMLIQSTGTTNFEEIPSFSLEQLREGERSGFEMSDAQRRLWVLSQFEESSVAYNIPGVSYLHEKLHVENFIKAIHSTIERHEILRTVFKENDEGELRQWIVNTDQFPFEVRFIDFREEQNSQERFTKLVQEDAEKPFDLKNGPLIRATLFQFQNNDFCFYYNLHHIISDGWSKEVLSKDVLEYYQAFQEDRSPNLVDLRIQYKEFSAWQLEQLKGDEYEEDKAFWLNSLSGELPVIDLPTKGSRPLLKTYSGRSLTTFIDREDTEKMNEYVQNHNGSLFMGLLAVWNTILYRYTSQDEVVVGTAVAGRKHADLENQIGFYVNLLALKNQINSHNSFNDCFEKVKINTIESFSHQSYPFDRLVEDLHLERDTSRGVLFDTFFSLDNSTEDASDFELSPTEINGIRDNGPILEKFDMSVVFKEMGGYISFGINYNTDIYNQQLMEDLMRHFKQLLKVVLDNPDEEISKVNFLSESERSRLKFEMNKTEIAYPENQTLLDLFAEQVTQAPNQVALTFRERSMTYAELDQRTDELAHCLLNEYNVESTDRIGICMESSEWLLISMLATLKTGAAYVPIDPKLTTDRREFIISDIQPNVLLILSESVLDVSEHNVEAFSVDLQLADWVQKHPVIESKWKTVTPAQSAYIIYTSGSTGTPKGVEVTHANMYNYLSWAKNTYLSEIGSGNCFGLYSSPSFDLTVTSLFLPLISGGVLHIYPPEMEVSELLQNYFDPITPTNIIKLTPSHVQVLKYLKLDETNIQTAIVGGEELHRDHVRTLRKLNPKMRIFNEYGPTECTVGCTVKEVENEDNITIGKPIANTQVYIVDALGNLQPEGIVGELVIGGKSVARGYFHNENETNERFISPAFLDTATRVYRTGDLAKWLPNGELAYLGRNDDQVKVKGHRVELGEIEARIGEISFVQEACVMIEKVSEEVILNACVVLSDAHNHESTNVESQLQSILRQQLPEYMIPRSFWIMEHIPVTKNGKVDKKELLRVVGEKSAKPEEVVLPKNEFEERIAQLWKQILKREEISTDKGFFAAGGDSIKLIELKSKMEKKFGSQLRVADLYQYTTIQQQAAMLKKEQEESTSNDANESLSVEDSKMIEQEDIAVIGMAIRAPGSQNIHEFWMNLKEGKDSITHFSKEELLKEGVTQQELDHPNYVRSNSYLTDKEFFDSSFFGYLPDEAGQMDPQTRVFHEVVWAALDDAGYDPHTYQGMIGLYAGSPENVIWEIYSQLSNNDRVDQFAASHLSNSSYGNSLIAHKLNLKGPVNTSVTACSTSLVTIHQAAKSLLNGECHIAVAGGTSIKNKRFGEGYWYQEGMIYSKDGRNKTFDREGSGTVGGEGSGAVVLKRLSEAQKDGDQIYAVIKGSAINNDGDRKVGYTAPSVIGQAEVIQLALRNAGVLPESISYIEAHGTATSLGDPVEVLGLAQAFGKSDKKYCALGSVKSNVGHLDTAAGVAGFIKTVLCLKNKQLVPSLHFEKANPEINFENNPFYVNTETKEWKISNGLLRAGVSSFGIGGTNAHVVLEEAPGQKETEREERHELIVLSAKSKTALQRQHYALKDFLKENETVDLTNVAWTLQNRAAFNYRTALVAKNVAEAIHQLENNAPINQIQLSGTHQKKTVFLFSGQGTQYQNMGLGLYVDEKSTFRKTMDACFEIASKFSNVDFREILYPSKESDTADRINQTANTQPLLFMLEYAICEQLEDYGIAPDLMLGHSIGEYVAACKACVFSLEDALKLVIRRGELMQGLPKGNMLAIGLPETSAKQYTNEEIDIAAVNTPNSCVLSGPTSAIETLAKRLESEGVVAKILHTSHAFHSSMMDPILAAFTALVETVEIKRPKIPYISNLTGKVVTPTEWENPHYWANHIRGTVRFSEGVCELLQEDHLQIIEVGPGDTLVNMTRQHLEKGTSVELNTVVRHPKVEKDDTAFLLTSLAHMWSKGINLNWKKSIGGVTKRKISLPTYSFDKIKYPDGYMAYEFVMSGLGNLHHEQRLEEDKWFYEPYWKPSKLRASAYPNEGSEPFLVFCDTHGVAEELIQLIQSAGGTTISVQQGENFLRKDNTSFEINPERFSDYAVLFSELKKVEQRPFNVIHMFSLNNESNEDIQKNMSLGYYSILHIAKELQKYDGRKQVGFTTITNRAEHVFDGEEIFPSKGMMSGINTVINQENQWVRTKMIDVDSFDNASALSQLVWHDLLHASKEKQIAYRNGKRWTKAYNSIDTSMLTLETSAFKQHHTYVITGGLGGFGYILAEHLLAKYQANLILLGRTEESQLGERAARLSDLKNKGNVAYYSADLSDFTSTQKAFLAGEQRFGKINGVVHAAGTINGNSFKGINFLTQAECEEQFVTKVQGTNVLGKLLEGKELDFCLFTSSLASVIGGKEFGAYASANSYLDSFARTNKIKNCLSINFDGLAVNRSGNDGTALLPEEIIRVIEKALQSVDDRQLSVSLTDLNERIERWVHPELIQEEFLLSKEEDFRGVDRPALSNEFIEPETETEKEVCQLLESFFGLNTVGVEDDFFELGGDSLKAMTMISRIHQKFNIQLQLREVMQNANVRSLSKEIDVRLKLIEMEQKRSKTNFDNKIEL